MGSSKSDIRRMIERHVEAGAEFVLICTDTFDYTTYSVGCLEKDFAETYAHYKTYPMTRIMEVYDLSLDIEEQLNEFRAFHYPNQVKNL